jgi:FAD/FMN-containing dehydrogenase
VKSNTSKRVFLKRAASVAVTTALSSSLGRGAFAKSNDGDLDALADALSKQSSGGVVWPDDPAYATIKYYNGRFDCVRTKAYVRPTSAEGVQSIVLWANNRGRSFAIRGAGHSFEGRSSHPDLVIDMSQLKKLSFKAGILDVEAGVVLGDVYKTLTPAGHVLPAGTCPTVGIVGHTLGGGIGDFLPMFGYAAQSLTSATLVTMAGDILEVGDQRIDVVSEAPDGHGKARRAGLTPQLLMKALRGSGQGSFGVITHMTFKTRDVHKFKLASFRLHETSSVGLRRSVEIIDAWQTWRTKLPEATRSLVSSKLNLSRSGKGYDFDIMGLIAIPPGAGVEPADIRQSLAGLFGIAEFKKREFTENLTVAGAIKTFLDDDDTTHNPQRKMLYGSSSALSAALSPQAIHHLLQKMDPSIFASLYTSGGYAHSAKAPQTSLHASEFLIEWATYSKRRDATAHRKIRALRTEVIKIAGLADHGFPNYPDDSTRDYFTDRPALEQVRRALDPGAKSTSSLLGDQPPPLADATCR